MRRGLNVVTANTSEFSRVATLSWQDWTKRAGVLLARIYHHDQHFLRRPALRGHRSIATGACVDHVADDALAHCLAQPVRMRTIPCSVAADTRRSLAPKLVEHLRY